MSPPANAIPCRVGRTAKASLAETEGITGREDCSVGDKIRLGFVGAGYMGQVAHIANYAKIDDCELVALADGRNETATAVARRYGIDTVYRDHHELLDKADVDAVVCTMFFSLHHSLVQDILTAGKSLATEKPMCICLDHARQLQEEAEKSGVLYQLGYMKRHDPGAMHVREKIQAWKQSGECGQLRYVRVTMPPGDWIAGHESPINCGERPPSYDGQTVERPPEWMTQAESDEYIGFINFFVHQVNLIRYLIGEDYTVTYADPHHQTLTAVSESGAVIVLEMGGYGLTNRWEESYRICFDEARITLDVPPPLARQRCGEVSIYRSRGFTGTDAPEELKPMLTQRWAFEEQARAFVRCLRDGTPTIAPPSEGIKDLVISEEYIRALDRGQT